MMTSKALADRLSALAGKFSVAGASAALWHDGTLVRAETGTANAATGAPVRPDTLFAAGSITKVFTASLAMTLVDEGLLDLDAPVRTYLPDFRHTNPGRFAAITVRMLLNHSSGLPANYMPDLVPGEDALERLMPEIGALPIVGEPGERWSYSNMGMSTLGRLVEVRTGQSYDAALRTRILEPLGLNATADADEMVLRSAAAGHTVDPDTGEVTRVPRLRLGPENGPAGSRLWLDVEALIRFGRMHFDGTAPDGSRILSRAALDRMREPQFDDFWGCFPMYRNYGLGWAIVRGGPDPVLSHGGGNLGMASNLFVLPGQKAVLAVLTNSATGPQLHSTLCAEVLEECFDVRGPEPVPAAATTVEIDSERFIGRYQAPHGQVSVDVHDGRLCLQVTPEPKLAEWEKVMGSPASKPEPLPLRCVDGERNRFLMDLGGPGASVPVQFYGTGPDGRPALVRVITLYERTA
ncbi:serine hydrolase domain-containing protein [Amycolatopsis silviterrae]|uniref:Serine hydrolase domain-containing protein n=1 Tax=Amycolatopsis silviterrae TaxID=1656914 RepID=A0ABW5H6U2_9PSEU